LDFSSDIARRDRGVAAEVAALSRLGLEPEVVDLRDFFEDTEATQRTFEDFDGVWVLGGNVFTLRRAFR
jgi:dipeptidase E